ncbi:peptidoglycan-associated lipoprotein Pal [Marinivivus vitaminiproducens]|uniref:peptidoglycan-associated lipoprotein Pal n=1 Tax=Marinivivus vitaminiproducens TaxID=3035935 RepID=UPI0027A61C10|nr:peptidoglycan-associated lipoprotein Pal [Geminicoccaceae bacterium SCSIO 64248]
MANSRNTFRALGLGLVLVLAACSGNTPPPGADAAAMGGSGGIGTSTLDGMGVGGPVTPGSQQDLEVNVGDRVFFGLDSTTLDNQSQETLRRQAAWLNDYPNLVVTIEGHADERGTREYNLALGDRRANAVKSYLVALGVDASRVLTISYGAERPENPGSDETAWAENRRAVTRINVVN